MKYYVSIILPTFNRATTIKKSIDSVLNQTYKNFELIIIDDGSTDNTRDLVKQYKDKRIKYIHYKENKGASYARNLGIKKAKYDLIAFQDSDDKWTKYMLRKLVNSIKDNESTNVVYTDMLRVKKNGEKIYWHSPDVVKGKIINEENNDYQVANIGLITILSKKFCIEKIGGFDIELKKFIDLDFFIRLAKEYKMYHIKEPLALYYENEGISTNYYNGYKAREYLLKKYTKYFKKNRKFIADQNYKICFFLLKAGLYSKARSYCKKAVNYNNFNIKFRLVNLLLKYFPGLFRKFYKKA